MSQQTFEMACMKSSLGKLVPAFRHWLTSNGYSPDLMTIEELDRAIEGFGNELRNRYLWHDPKGLSSGD